MKMKKLYLTVLKQKFSIVKDTKLNLLYIFFSLTVVGKPVCFIESISYVKHRIGLWCNIIDIAYMYSTQ